MSQAEGAAGDFLTFVCSGLSASTNILSAVSLLAGDRIPQHSGD